MARTKATLQKLLRMKKQNIMSQMKGQEKTPEKQLNEVEIGNLPEKRIRNGDSEDDPGSWKKNEDAKNVISSKISSDVELRDMLSLKVHKEDGVHDSILENGHGISWNSDAVGEIDQGQLVVKLPY